MNKLSLQQKSAQSSRPRLIDFHPPHSDMRCDVLEGLAKPQKELLPKYFYDERGSHLFDDITKLPEYYLTRTEDSIMQASWDEIAQLVGPRAAVIEFGSGSGAKIRRLLKQLVQPVACVPVEISREHLVTSARALADEHPQLEVIAVCADFTQPFELPPISGAQRNLVFFPGSTIGNFPPAEAIELLKVMRMVAGDDGALLIGADLVKDTHILEAAYNDSQGITAAFNLNLLRRINSELDANFNLAAFGHTAVFNQAVSRIEMYLESRCRQVVQIGDQCIRFDKGERIRTEYAYKYELASFAELVSAAGFNVEQVWTDPEKQFSVQYAG